MKKRVWLLSFAALFSSGELLAHHAANAFFAGPQIVLEGTLTGSKLSNPHAYIRLTEDSGMEWAVESALSWTYLQRRGYDAELFAEGRRIRAFVDSNQDGKPFGRFVVIAFLPEQADGNWQIILGAGARDPWVGEIRQEMPCVQYEDCYIVDAETRAEIASRFPDVSFL